MANKASSTGFGHSQSFFIKSQKLSYYLLEFFTGRRENILFEPFLYIFFQFLYYLICLLLAFFRMTAKMDFNLAWMGESSQPEIRIIRI